MPSLKLVSVYANPCKLVRTLATSAPPSPAAPKSSRHPTRPSPLTLNVYLADKIRAVTKIPPCANQVLCNPSPDLGFRARKPLSSSSPVAKSYSSDDRVGGVLSSTSTSASGGVAGRDSDDRDGKRSQNGGLHRQEDQSDDDRPSKLLTLPTILTIARLAAVPLLVNTFYMDSWLGTTATTGIFVFASVTDWLDGYLARKMKLSSQFGAFLDPVADKLMVATTLILLCTRPPSFDTFGQVPWLLTLPAIAIIGREITMSAVREWAASQDSKLLEAVAVNNLGKWKTATQMTALTILLATRDTSLVGAGGVVATGVVLLYISAILAVWSLFVYMKKISKVLLR
uniref:CDP-diacylglycerol--glycerol-3-phosphate 1-phosphatidyltransferase n=1 Tax=Kalanchoe fedtschenkoi TaxID=63787 RepID=A0A7N0V730_KALFE